MLLLIQTALAADIVGAVGTELVFNDPFVTTYGLRLGAELEARPWLALGLSGGVHPTIGDSTIRRLTSQLVSDLSVIPDTTDIQWRAMTEVRLTPLEVTSGGWTHRLSGHVGIGGIRTVDDDHGFSDDPEFLRTQTQLHPLTAFGLSGELQRDRLGVRLRIERTAYVEEISGSTESSRNNAWVGAEMTVRGPG